MPVLNAPARQYRLTTPSAVRWQALRVAEERERSTRSLILVVPPLSCSPPTIRSFRHLLSSTFLLFLSLAANMWNRNNFSRATSLQFVYRLLPPGLNANEHVALDESARLEKFSCSFESEFLTLKCFVLPSNVYITIENKVTVKQLSDTCEIN